MGERGFFQIAVALIPILTFGGAFLSRPPETDRRPRGEHSGVDLGAAFGVLSFALLAFFAEVIAIRGAVIGEGTTFDRFVVITMILVGMVAIAAQAVVPRFQRVIEASGPRERRHHKIGLSLLVPVTIALIWSSVGLLNESVRFSETEVRIQRIERLQKQLRQGYDRLTQIDRRKSTILFKARALESKDSVESRFGDLRLRHLRDEYKSEVRTERLELRQIESVVDALNAEYQNLVP